MVGRPCCVRRFRTLSGYFLVAFWSLCSHFLAEEPKMSFFSRSLLFWQRGRTVEDSDALKASVATGSQLCCLLSDFLPARVVSSVRVFLPLRGSNVRTRAPRLLRVSESPSHPSHPGAPRTLEVLRHGLLNFAPLTCTVVLSFC